MQKDIETLTTLNHDFVKSVQGADVKRFDEILAKTSCLPIRTARYTTVSNS
jgi:hypothetical protein